LRRPSNRNRVASSFAAYLSEGGRSGAERALGRRNVHRNLNRVRLGFVDRSEAEAFRCACRASLLLKFAAMKKHWATAFALALLLVGAGCGSGERQKSSEHAATISSAVEGNGDAPWSSVQALTGAAQAVAAVCAGASKSTPTVRSNAEIEQLLTGTGSTI